jgi:plastocyanin
MNNKTLAIIFAVVIAVIGLVYFGGSGYGPQNPPSNIPPQNTPSNNPPQNNPPQGSIQVSIKNFAFDPAEVNINKGDTVTWTNNDSVTHIISGDGFNSGSLGNGQSYSFTFNTAGKFDYICSIHTYMKGSVVVK